MFGTLVSGDRDRGGVFDVDARRPRGDVDIQVNRDCRWLLLRTRRARLLRTMPVAKAIRILNMVNIVYVCCWPRGARKEGKKSKDECCSE